VLQYGKSLAVMGWNGLKAGAQLGVGAVRGIGQFTFALVTGKLNVMQFTAGLFRSGVAALRAGAMWTIAGVKSLPGLTLGFLRSGAAAVAAGASWLWTAVTGLPSLITSLASATVAQVGLNLAMYANPVGVFIAGMVAIGAAVAGVVYYWDDLKKYILEFGAWLWKYNPLNLFLNLLDGLAPGFRHALESMFDDLVKWFSKAWGWLGDKLGGLKNLFGNLFSSSVSLPTNPFAGMDGLDDRDKGPAPSATLAKQNKGVDIEGDRSKARIVNLRIDKIEANVYSQGAPELSMEELKEKVAAIILGAARDTEIVLSAG